MPSSTSRRHVVRRDPVPRPRTANFRGPDEGEVSHPFLVRRGRRKLPVQAVRRNRALQTLPFVHRSLASFRLSQELQRPHQPGCTLSANIMTPVLKVRPDATHAAGLAAVGEAPADIPDQFFVVQRPITRRSRPPAVEPAWRDIEHPAHPCHRPDHSMLRNELELHYEFFAK